MKDTIDAEVMKGVKNLRLSEYKNVEHACFSAQADGLF
jgi:hypothetical protein